MDIDLRKLRYFVAVAEELHFGRAAERLYITQPVLSRQIRALEQDLGTTLFARNRRSTELTPTGQVLLEEARPLLASATALTRRLTRAAHGAPAFTIAFMPGTTVTAAVRALTARHPGLTVNLMRTTWDDQTDVLHDGRADAGLVRMPVEQHGLRLLPLYTEPRVAVVSTEHRLAGKTTIKVADLAGEPMLQAPDAVPEWRDLPGRLTGHPATPRPVFHSVEEKLEHVAACHGVIVLPLSVAAYYTRPDVTHVPVDDIPPNQVCLAWSRTRRSPLVQEFADIAADHFATTPRPHPV
ncbi:LysR substrate-binding domain-containing protein [Sphaerisporangium sp. NPDC005289]|uniref:LysR family transcriptional regulator n=1 Tax=Sphaerisporangium sp. NPDC005289 TaxID=3155247 RepID=UPI0033A78C1F